MRPQLLFFFGVMFFVFHSIFAAENNFPVFLEKIQGADNVLNYWTTEKIKNAKPLTSPALKGLVEVHPTVTQKSTKVISSRGAPPTLYDPTLEEQLNPAPPALFSDSELNAEVLTDIGALHMFFTSSRLVPETANRFYPYLTIGRLFFKIPKKGNFTCSASVLQNRIIFTAGHCVHSGLNGKNGFYTHFMFIPAFYYDQAPVGRWAGDYAAVHAKWANGGGTIPNEADYGMIELKDRHMNCANQPISLFTGYLGYRTESLDRNHAHLLGYPCNFDACQQMHQVSGETGRTVAAKNVEYGSDMREGSDGSPWVQNFGEQGAGELPGPNAGINQILGVVSYFYEDPNKMAEGGSGLDNRFLTLLNKICSHQPDNCI